jgi:hypothetical protein
MTPGAMSKSTQLIAPHTPGSRAGSSVFGRRRFQGVLKPSLVGKATHTGETPNFLHVHIAEKKNLCYVFLVAGLMSGLLGGLLIGMKKKDETDFRL